MHLLRMATLPWHAVEAAVHMSCQAMLLSQLFAFCLAPHLGRVNRASLNLVQAPCSGTQLAAQATAMRMGATLRRQAPKCALRHSLARPNPGCNVVMHPALSVECKRASTVLGACAMNSSQAALLLGS